MNLATERLELRPVAAPDLPAVHALWTTAHVRRFLFDDRDLSLDETRALVAASEATFREHGWGIWLAFEKSTGALVGFAGFLRREEAPSLVYGVRSESVGLGYATEASAALLRHAAERLGIRRIDADVDEPNRASVRVLERLGMKPLGRTLVAGKPLLNFTWSA